MTARRNANGEGTVYQRKDGRWEASAYVLAPGGTRRRISVYAATRRDAVALLREKITASTRGMPTRTRIPTLADYLTWWLTDVEAHRVRPSTLELLHSTVNVHLIPGLGRRPLDKLTIADVRTFITSLQTTCQCCAQNKERRRAQPRCCAIGQCCGQHLAPTTIHRIHQVLVTALSHAIREEYLHRNVAALVKVPSGRDGHKPRALTLNQAKALLDAASDHRLFALVHLALLTGMRRGELLGLRWQDIDLDAGTLTIHQTLQRLVGRGIIFTPRRWSITGDARTAKRPSPPHAGTKADWSSPPATANRWTPTASPRSSTGSAPSQPCPTSASTTCATPPPPSSAKRAPNCTSPPASSATPT
jgi:integrase